MTIELFIKVVLPILSFIFGGGIVWKLYQFRQDREKAKIDAKKKSLEHEQLQLRHRREYEEALGRCEGGYVTRNNIHINSLTPTDNMMLTQLFERQQLESHAILLEWAYLYKLSGGKDPILSGRKRTFVEWLEATN
jgi:hypothetical protein